MSAALLSRVSNQLAQAVQLGIGHSGRGEIEQCRDRLFRRAIEECVEDLAQRRLARALNRHRRHEHVARTVFFMPQVPLLFAPA